MSSRSKITTSPVQAGVGQWRVAGRVEPDHPHSGLPFVYINVATTADGKLAPANRVFVPFAGQRDQELLLELRTNADAVMAGARTIDLYPVNMGPGPKKYRQMRLRNGLSEYNLR